MLKVAREYTGMTLRELSAERGGMNYAAVRMGLRRFDMRRKQNRMADDIHEIYKHLRQMLYV